VWLYEKIEPKLKTVGKGRVPIILEALYSTYYIEEHGVLDEKELELAKAVDTESEYSMALSEMPSPGYSKIKKLVGNVQHQGKIGTCVPWTVHNICQQYARERGLDGMSVGITPVYSDLRLSKVSAGADSGSDVKFMFKSLADRGVPQETVPHIFNRKDLLEIDKDESIDSCWDITSDILGDIVDTGADMERLAYKLDRLNPQLYKVQLSLDVYRPNFWQKIYSLLPLPRKSKSGRHSVAAVFMDDNGKTVGVCEEKGSTGIWVMDSGDGIPKFLSFDFLHGANAVWRIVKMKDETIKKYKKTNEEKLQEQLIAKLLEQIMQRTSA